MSLNINQTVRLADGTDKEISLLTQDDLIATWNFYTGEFEYNKCSYLCHENMFGFVTTIELSNNTTLVLKGNHSLYSPTMECFVHINDLDVGDDVLSIDGTPVTITTKTKVFHQEDDRQPAMQIVTENALCYYINGILCGNGFCNSYTIENMKYTQEKHEYHNKEEFLEVYFDCKEFVDYASELFDVFHMSESILDKNSMRHYAERMYRWSGHNGVISKNI